MKRRLQQRFISNLFQFSAPPQQKAVETTPTLVACRGVAGDQSISKLAGLTCDSIPGASASLLSPNDLSIEAAVQRTSSAACRLAGRACLGRRTPGSQIADELEPITMIPVIVCGEPGIMSRNGLTATACTHFRPPFSSVLRTAWPQGAAPSRFFF